MKRRTPPAELTEAFREQAFLLFTHGGPEADGQPLRLFDGGPACWLKRHDPLDRPCSGQLEAFHFVGRQRIRNVLRLQLTTDLLADGAIDPADVDDLVEQAEWDPRNGGPGCTGHHRRFDNHATPGLQITATALPSPVRAFVLDWGFEMEVERKFLEPDEAKWLQQGVVHPVVLDRTRRSEAATAVSERSSA